MNSLKTGLIGIGVSLLLVNTVRAQPNFLVIIADDMGFSDAGCYGGEISTPNLDSLADGGLRFTQFYNTARCWPTRAALMSGYYPQQIRRDAMPGVDHRQYGGRGQRPAWAKLIPEYLKPLGYRTYHSGKWHIDGKPMDNGFDQSDEIKVGSSFFISEERLEERSLSVTAPKDHYLTVATANHAIACLETHAARHVEKPFFHYVAFHAPHFPLQALPEDIARYDQTYQSGWDHMRRERHRRLRQLQMTNSVLSPLEPNVGPPYLFADDLKLLGANEVDRPVSWTELTVGQRSFQAKKMAIHAAMIHRMDLEIGRILDQLRQMNVFDNTLVLFLSDNGASAEIMVRGHGHDPTVPMGSAKSYLCLGPGFSSACNTPYRRHKTWVHEGGISTPLIVHWPNGIQSKAELRHTVGHVIDIAPTILQLAGAGDTRAKDAPPLPGTSLAKVFGGDGEPLHDAVWFYHEGNRALRQGDWKIVNDLRSRPYPYHSASDQSSSTSAIDWRLYNLSSDRAEQNDLANSNAEKVQAMSMLWDQLNRKFLEDSSANP